MRLRFTKMHGLGNDFVVIDGISQSVDITPARARKLADRHRGIGCDQVLIVEAPSSPEADFCYRIFNSDGGEVENCGNGARCFAVFVKQRGLTVKDRIVVETAGGLLTLECQANGLVTVDMGTPVLAPAAIPFDAENQAVTYPLDVDGQTLEVSCLSMGNPHAVTIVEDPQQYPVSVMGAKIEQHPRFPARVNAGFMSILSPQEIDLRVFERGVGETLACGTGACAAVVAGQLRGLLHNEVKVNLPGGQLHISWEGSNNPVMMTGPAQSVFYGQVSI